MKERLVPTVTVIISVAGLEPSGPCSLTGFWWKLKCPARFPQASTIENTSSWPSPTGEVRALGPLTKLAAHGFTGRHTKGGLFVLSAGEDPVPKRSRRTKKKKKN